MEELTSLRPEDNSPSGRLLRLWGFAAYDLDIQLHALAVQQCKQSELSTLVLAKKLGYLSPSRIDSVATGVQSKHYDELLGHSTNKSLLISLFPELEPDADYLCGTVKGYSYIRGLKRHNLHSMMGNPDVREYCNENKLCVIDVADNPHIVVGTIEKLEHIRKEAEQSTTNSPLLLWLHSENLPTNVCLANQFDIDLLLNTSSAATDKSSSLLDIDSASASLQPIKELVLSASNKRLHELRIRCHGLSAEARVEIDSILNDDSLSQWSDNEILIAIRTLLQRMGISYSSFCSSSQRASLCLLHRSPADNEQTIGLILTSSPILDGVRISLNFVYSDELEGRDARTFAELPSSGLILPLTIATSHIKPLMPLIGFANSSQQLGECLALSENFPTPIDGVGAISITNLTPEGIKEAVQQYANIGVETLLVGDLFDRRLTLFAVYAASHGMRVFAQLQGADEQAVLQRLHFMIQELEPHRFTIEELRHLTHVISTREE